MITEPVQGWKLLGWDRGHLVSPVFYTVWHPAEKLRAMCRYSSQPAPCGMTWPTGEDDGPEDCACGIYLCTSVLECLMAREGISTFTTPRTDIFVMARVNGWGKVKEFTQGWRVEYAYPYECFTESEETARAIRSMYAVDASVRTKW